MMHIEVRADGARLSGYVNVTEKKSRPVITPRGKVVEEIEPRLRGGHQPGREYHGHGGP